jgi:hypothetical protein
MLIVKFNNKEAEKRQKKGEFKRIAGRMAGAWPTGLSERCSAGVRWL